MIIQRSLSIQFLAGILAIGSWWWLQLSTSEQKHDTMIEGHTADYYSLGYQKQEMDTFGLLKSEVKAAKMLHYGDDNSVHLEAPEIRFFTKKSPPWVIKAEQGVLSDAGKELWLTGEVLVSRLAAEGGRAIFIKTSNVRVQPATSDAETEQWAELKSPPNVTTGVGMQLHFADPVRIALLSQVRGKYEKR